MKICRIICVFVIYIASEMEDLHYKENRCAPSGGVHVHLTTAGLGKQIQ